MAESGKQHLVTAVTEEKGTTCWGCGLGLLLPTLGSAFKCGWCGAITNHNLNRELCRRSESSALHSFSNFSYIQHNLRNSDVCIYEFPYMAAIEVQTAGTLDHFQHGSGDVGKQGRSCGIVKLSNGTAGKRVGFNLSFHCQHIGGDKLSVLLWQQLCYIYEGRTYLSHLSSREGDHVKEKDCQNLLRFFGCRYSMLRFLPTLRNSRKRHKT
ncbi:hypothetical protein F383_02992 [Gossypium arboreum]|uniref:Uncharacterized protein n=1 Tax=Gossypium arboreum TaxID=29729 RepID=A0A0B0NMT8_GOSAR|nr:hypothetical protein F383_02992 [Gossypium arboreum]